MIHEYLKELDELISASPEVRDVEVVRKSVWDTGLEKVAVYRYRLKMSDRSLLELTERLVEEKGTLSIKKYRHHWQSPDSPFPHHLHDVSEINLVGCCFSSGFQSTIINQQSSIL